MVASTFSLFEFVLCTCVTGYFVWLYAWKDSSNGEVCKTPRLGAASTVKPPEGSADESSKRLVRSCSGFGGSEITFERRWFVHAP